MKCLIGRETLLAALQNVIGVVERRQTMSVLANFLLILHENSLEIVASDLEMEVISIAPLLEPAAQIGTITTPARKFFDVCRTLSEKSNISLVLDGSRLQITTDNSEFDLVTLPANQYPRLETEQETFSFALQKEALHSLVRRTHFAIAEQTSHYYLKGMLFEIKDSIVRAVASDAHRLAMCTIVLSHAVSFEARVIVPRKVTAEFLRILEWADDVIDVQITPNFIRFAWQNFVLTSKLILSKYPNPNKFIPEDGDKRIILNRTGFRDALLRVGILTSEVLRGVKLQLRPNLLLLLANNPEAELAEDQIAINYEGQNLDIAFNINYLVDALSSLTTEEIALTAKGSEDGVLIEEVNGTIDTINVVMPLEI